MTQENVIKGIHNVFIEGFEIEEEILNGAATLDQDLGLDSLDGLDLVVALEKEFDIRIPEETAREMRVLQDIYDYVDNNVQ